MLRSVPWHVSDPGLGRGTAPHGEPAVSPRTVAELLIDCEEDRTLPAVLVGMLRESDRGR
jgi:hypothetical protein